MKKLALAAVAVAMTAFVPGRVLTSRALGSRNASVAPGVHARVDPPNAVHARVTFTNGDDVRALAFDADHDAVWAATSGGLDRYDVHSHARTHFGVESGLDSLDVRSVHVVPLVLVVETAEARCVQSSDPNFGGFTCVLGRPPAPSTPSDETLSGAPVVARIATDDGTFIATRGAGVWLAPADATKNPERLDARATNAASFVRKIAFYKHREWAGTFDDGLVTMDGAGAHAVPHAPMRMVNDVAASDGTLFIAANEGFFFTRDGSTFERVDAIGHGVTGIARFRERVFVTTTSAVWRLRVGRHAIVEANFFRPAGTRSIQGIAMSAAPNGGAVAWMASEDRGVIRFDPSANTPRFVSFDKLGGAPTSWVVALAGDDHGGVFAATLRDGVFHVGEGGAFASIAGVPNAWTLDASFASGKLCVGTQSGAACWSDWTKSPSSVFVGLPDRRVHDIERVGEHLFISTEAGLAEVDAT